MWSGQEVVQIALWVTQFLLTLLSTANSAKVVSWRATKTTKSVQKIHLRPKETRTSPAKGHNLCDLSYKYRLYHIAPALQIIFPLAFVSICRTLCL